MLGIHRKIAMATLAVGVGSTCQHGFKGSDDSRVELTFDRLR
jgi:hypothetical protein